MALTKKVFYTLTVFMSLLIVILTFSNQILCRCFLDNEIFDKDFSAVAKTVGYELSAWGRERSYYSFYVVYEGNTSNLLSIVQNLGLEKVESASKPLVKMNRYKKTNWWIPPSHESSFDYSCFEKEVRQEDQNKLLKCRAELIDTKLYIMQTGDLKSLKRQLEKSKNIKRFLL